MVAGSNPAGGTKELLATCIMADKARQETDPSPQQGSQLQQALEQVATESSKPDKNQSRVDVLMGVGRVDSYLQQLLERRLTPSTADVDDLLGEGQLLGSFMLRAKLALRLGLISPDFYAVLKTLSKIRNVSAHSEERIDIFGNQATQDQISNIWARLDKDFKRSQDKTIEQRFLFLCDVLSAVLKVTARNVDPLMTADMEVIFKRES
jgi:DNA-binding MltR family transcriptional regulator